MVASSSLGFRQPRRTLRPEWGTQVGTLTLPWVTITQTWGPETIVSRLADVDTPTPDIVAARLRDVEARFKRRYVAGERVPWNGRIYRLLDIGFHQNGPVSLVYGTSSYYHTVATDLALDEPLTQGSTLRETYLREAQLGRRPVTEIACMAGNVQVSVTTADDMLVMTKRAPLAVGPNRIGGAAAEGADPDQDGPRAPDAETVTRRALGEELGLSRSEYTLQPLGFGVETDIAHYTFLSHATTTLTLAELQQRRAAAYDAWESHGLVGWAWDPSVLRTELAANGAALMSGAAGLLVHTLRARLGHDETEQLLTGVHGHAGNQLPNWCYQLT